MTAFNASCLPRFCRHGKGSHKSPSHNLRVDPLRHGDSRKRAYSLSRAEQGTEQRAKNRDEPPIA